MNRCAYCHEQINGSNPYNLQTNRCLLCEKKLKEANDDGPDLVDDLLGLAAEVAVESLLDNTSNSNDDSFDSTDSGDHGDWGGGGGSFDGGGADGDF